MRNRLPEFSLAIRNALGDIMALPSFPNAVRVASIRSFHAARPRGERPGNPPAGPLPGDREERSTQVFFMPPGGSPTLSTNTPGGYVLMTFASMCRMA